MSKELAQLHSRLLSAHVSWCMLLIGSLEWQLGSRLEGTVHYSGSEFLKDGLASIAPIEKLPVTALSFKPEGSGIAE